MDIKTEFISDYTREKIEKAVEKAEAIAEAKGRAEALLGVLRARGLSVDEATAQRIRSCSDIALLDSWLERAVRVRTADELFD